MTARLCSLENSDENLNDSTYCGRSECLVLGQGASFGDGLAKKQRLTSRCPSLPYISVDIVSVLGKPITGACIVLGSSIPQSSRIVGVVNLEEWKLEAPREH